MRKLLTKIGFSLATAVVGLTLSQSAMALDLGIALPAGAEVAMAARLSNTLGSAAYPKITPPVHGAPITSAFGWRRHPIFKRMRFHGGIDFGARTGTPVHAAAAGTVVKVARTKDRGRYVVVRHSNLFETGYSHLATIKPGIKVGTQVKADEVIGTVGTSGRSTGPHLDFEAFIDSNRVDPAPMLIKAVITAETMPAESLQLVMTQTLSAAAEIRTATLVPVQLEASTEALSDRPV